LKEYINYAGPMNVKFTVTLTGCCEACYLFNDTVCNSYYVESNDWMAMNWKWCVRNQPCWV